MVLLLSSKDVYVKREVKQVAANFHGRIAIWNHPTWGTANLVKDASCWQQDYEWRRDIAVVIKWLSRMSPYRWLSYRSGSNTQTTLEEKFLSQQPQASVVLYLPESPRWLVSKGKMIEAKQVLQKLRGRENVSELQTVKSCSFNPSHAKFLLLLSFTAEMALLVEGLAVGGDTSIEEYIIGPRGRKGANQTSWP
ncbi:hypothetical protein POM88_001761 [Heracleum sosnowskyi]|uniref:Uncharacterized protein n=1 Tax=Heracleum sosnowskyi TaxID=360622 RepID=A0AAD8JEB3_9APIA|nr:hypothetical protein POM88_001761 [Heracleum sosnowskyi]